MADLHELIDVEMMIEEANAPRSSLPKIPGMPRIPGMPKGA